MDLDCVLVVACMFGSFSTDRKTNDQVDRAETQNPVRADSREKESREIWIFV